MNTTKLSLINSKIVSNAISLHDDSMTPYLYQWRDDVKYNRMFIAAYDGVKLASFILLVKMDFDPIAGKNNPWLISLIYTVKQYRRTGLMTYLLSKIKHMTLSAHCANDKSISCFY